MAARDGNSQQLWRFSPGLRGWPSTYACVTKGDGFHACVGGAKAAANSDRPAARRQLGSSTRQWLS